MSLVIEAKELFETSKLAVGCSGPKWEELPEETQAYYINYVIAKEVDRNKLNKDGEVC